MKNWNLLLLSALLILPAAAQQPPVCQTVTADQIGADGLNTAAIQAKLDACGAGTKQVSVELSAAKGSSFASGALYVSSNVVLWLDAGVVLNASTNPADFQRSAISPTKACDSSSAPPACGTLNADETGCQALISSCKSTNAGVGGPGTIEGHGWSPLTGGANTGTTWWALAGAAKAGNYVQSLNAPKMINFQQSTGISLSGFTIHNAPLVHILLGRANGANVTQVTIVTPTPDHTTSAFPYNSDGMDLSGSSNIQVDRLDFTDGDDNIAMEAGGGGPVNNITVTNSTFRAGHGLSIGSETNSGATNVTANNIRFIGTDNGLRIKSDMSKGGLVDSIQYSDICMTSVGNPIVIDPNYSTATGNLLPLYKNVEIDGMWADGGSLTLKAFAGQPPLSLTLNNVRTTTSATSRPPTPTSARYPTPTFPSRSPFRKPRASPSRNRKPPRPRPPTSNPTAAPRSDWAPADRPAPP